MPVFLPEALVLILKILGIVAAFVAAACFVVVAYLIVWIRRFPPEDWK